MGKRAVLETSEVLLKGTSWEARSFHVELKEGRGTVSRNGMLHLLFHRNCSRCKHLQGQESTKTPGDAS